MFDYGYENNWSNSTMNSMNYQRNLDNLKWELHKMGKDESWANNMPIPGDRLLSFNETRNMIRNMDAVRSSDPFTFARYEEEDRKKRELEKRIKEIEEQNKYGSYTPSTMYQYDTSSYRPESEAPLLNRIIAALIAIGLIGVFVYFFITDYCGYKLF
jgi:hypothetical protein